MDTTCKLAAAAGPELLRPHMPLLVPAMLESLRWAGGRAGSRVGGRLGGEGGETVPVPIIASIALSSLPDYMHCRLSSACCCSGLEDSRLNYIEQHAERLGLDSGRLEGARVAAAQGGPAGETLDLCARWVGGCCLVCLCSAAAWSV